MYFLFLILGALALAWTARAQSPAPKLEVEHLSEKSELENDINTHTWTGKNGIIIKQGSTVLVANEVLVNESTREVVADGAVVLQTEGLYWTGEHLEYNFKTRVIGSGSYRAGTGGLFVAAKSMAGNSTNKSFITLDADFTTDDLAAPGYHVRAKKLVIEEGKEAVAHDATLYIGKIPIFYLPYYQRQLGVHKNYWVVTPGYRSTLGPYLLTQYHVGLNEKFDAGVRLDYRQKRGPGAGPMLGWDLGKYGKGEGEYYFTPDSEAKSDPRLAGYSDDRQRAKFSHTVQLRTNAVAKTTINWQSDPQLIRDFYEGEYRQDQQPKTLFEASQYWPNFSLDVLAEPQINEFFPTVERLPDIKLSALRQQLGISPFYYEGESSFAYLRDRPGSLALNATNFAAMRGDTYHQIVLPKTFFGFLNVTPRAGGRLTHYSDTESPVLPLHEENRFVFNTGMETSFKASRLFPGARSRLLDVNELRHIVEPSLNYVYVPRPDEVPSQLPQFDRELPSLRLLPVDFPDYNTIDSIDARNVLRLGLRNKLQTKRDGDIDTLLNWRLVTDWRLEGATNQSTFSDVYSDLDFKPRRWLSFNSEIRYDINAGQLNLSSHSVTIAPGNVWSARFGHRYFRGDPAFGPDSDNNIFYSVLFYRFNENWGARMSHHFEARDGTLEEQWYSLYRDFRSFTVAFSFRIRDNRAGPVDYAVTFTISLKSRPAGPIDRLDPSLLLGY